MTTTSAACRVDNLPRVLTEMPQWVVWGLTDNGGNIIKKVPFNAKGGRGDVTDASTWSDFDTARANSHFGGRIGFVLTKDDDFACMDIDHCLDPETGDLTSEAREIVSIFDTYTEISASGTGVHIWVRLSTKINEKDKKKHPCYEMYQHKRYIIMTGNRLPGTPADTAWRDDEWVSVYGMTFSEAQTHAHSHPARQHALPFVSTGTDEALSDDEMIEKASGAKNGDKFLRLYQDGDSSDYKGDESAADLALCRIFAFWSGRHGHDQIERLFFKSALGKREKWVARDEYREWTIQKAIDSQTEFYDPTGAAVSFTYDPQAVNDTEVGNAHRLHRQYGRDIRYVSELRKWVIWEGGFWRIGDADLVKRMALETVRGIYREAAEADGERRQALIRHANKSETKRGIDAMVDLARLLDGVSISAEELDANPWLLNVANGTIELKSGKLREADRADALTEQVAIEFDPNAKCPTFDAFLERVVPDQETRSFLQRAVGYSLSGVVREHALFFLYGTGKNGKSTFTTAIEALLGNMWTKTRSDVLMVSRFGANQGATPELAKLRGKRLVTVTEISSGARLDEALIKDMTGGDRISARSLYSEPITFIPTHKVWMYGNYKPDIRGADAGIWRRVMLVPFTQIITQEECDPALGDKLAVELPGVLAWAVRGCLAWQAQGLGEPPEVKKATQEYRNEMDLTGQFLAACCETGQGYRVGSTALYEAYKRYCADVGEVHRSHKLFSPAVKSRGHSECRNPDGKMGFLGLRLIPAAGALEKEAQDQGAPR